MLYRLISLPTVLALAVCSMTPIVASADGPSLFRMFKSPRSAKPINPDSVGKLSQQDGPWLILASTFVGEGAEGRARRLAAELRQDMKLPVFIYSENFDFTGTINYDPATSKRVRYQNEYEYDGYAVLVGEYDTANHPSIENDLQRIKSATPAVFSDKDEIKAETDAGSNNMAALVKTMKSKLTRKRGDQTNAPMRYAFVTRNPMLPAEFFEAPEVSAFVRTLNERVDYSLLQCEGKFTVVVRTFEGYGTIVNGKNEDDFKPSEERLDSMAKKANKMTHALRQLGVEAYQYHDRFRSLVTIGSFDELGRELPGGGFEYHPQIRSIMREYNARNVDPKFKRFEPTGGNGMVGKGIAKLPFDLEPKPIAVPKITRRSLYGVNRR